MRRVDGPFKIAYGDEVDLRRKTLRELLAANDKVLNDPPVFIEVGALADSSVNFTVRAWVNAADYWSLFFYMQENVYKKFAEVGLNIPFPQMDVHVDK